MGGGGREFKLNLKTKVQEVSLRNRPGHEIVQDDVVW